MIRGRLNVANLEATVQVNNKQLEGRSQAFIDRLWQANREARDKSLLMLECNTWSTLNPNEVWGKRGRA